MPPSKFKPLSQLPKETLERVWKYIDKRGPDECWPWTGTSRRGYGFIQTQTTRGHAHAKWLAHRIVYYLTTGDDPLDFAICHKCDNPSCNNPAHFFKGTRADNRMDCVHKRRHNFGALHGRARLTEKDVTTIRGLFPHMSARQIAEQYRVARSTIEEIKRGATWIHTSSHVIAKIGRRQAESCQDPSR